jgi:hypothetical protein
MQIHFDSIQLALVAFWALWFTIVWIMNILDALQVFCVLPEDWKAASGNYNIIAKHTDVYDAPEWLNRGMYLGVILWQGVVVIGLWIAFFGSLEAGALLLARVNFALGAGLFLFAAFLLADEILKIYDTAQQHMIIFIAVLSSLVLLHIQ